MLLEAASHREADLRQLGRLTRAGLAGDDDDLMRLDRLRDVGDRCRDRQDVGERDARAH